MCALEATFGGTSGFIFLDQVVDAPRSWLNNEFKKKSNKIQGNKATVYAVKVTSSIYCIDCPVPSVDGTVIPPGADCPHQWTIFVLMVSICSGVVNCCLLSSRV